MPLASSFTSHQTLSRYNSPLLTVTWARKIAPRPSILFPVKDSSSSTLLVDAQYSTLHHLHVLSLCHSSQYIHKTAQGPPYFAGVLFCVLSLLSLFDNHGLFHPNWSVRHIGRLKFTKCLDFAFASSVHRNMWLGNVKGYFLKHAGHSQCVNVYEYIAKSIWLNIDDLWSDCTAVFMLALHKMNEKSPRNLILLLL